MAADFKEGHGTREMMFVWRYALTSSDRPGILMGETPLAKAQVRHKIERLVDYSKTLQAA